MNGMMTMVGGLTEADDEMMIKKRNNIMII